LFARVRFSLFLAVLAGLLLPAAAFAEGPEAGAPSKAPSRLVDPIDEHVLVTLKGNVRQDLASAPDLGLVEDGKELHLFLLLQRTTAQQADLDNLIERQQQPTAQEYHKWLTPKEFGARFGASPEDIAKISTWLESHGFQIRNVLNNASMIDFAATAGQVRDTFHTELHYFNIRGGKHLVNVKDPQIPAALAPVVAGIKGLAKIPPLMNHTKARQGAYDKETHRWHTVNPTAEDKASPAYSTGTGEYFVGPQDLYTIYNVNPQFTAGNLGASATVAVIEESDIEFGTVNGSGLVTAGGDVNTFRSLFGVPGTLTMHVMHGAGSETCNDPGIDPSDIQEDEEASLDAEWINATAPSANEIFMSCDDDPDDGIFTSMAALIDNNLSDVMSMSYGETELDYTSGDYTFQDALYAQAATQGQSFFVSAGDSGSDVADQNTGGTATSGINVSAFGSPLTTVAGGTDFSDLYDALEGGPAQSTYWGSNSGTYGDALSYVPEMAWNGSCASSILAAYEGFTGAGFCGVLTAGDAYLDGFVVGGSGGISTHYAVPSWQTGISGYSNSKHAQPDIAGFASVGPWGHTLIFCDSNPADAIDDISCASPAADNFGLAGGTSFVAPYLAGVAGLLRAATGSRQGVLNPALYALAKAQYTAQPTQCYSNGQAANTGVTTGLPAASCIFNDVTTSNNDVPCQSGSTSCFVNSGDTYGMLSLNGSASLSVAFPSKAGFDQVTGIGTVNVNNLINKWSTAFSSGTTLSANPTTITSSQSTELKATVTGGAPTGYVDTPPALTGTATFKAGTTSLGNCTLSGGTCSLSVSGSALQAGANSVTATFSGSGTYPSSTSSIVTVTVTSGSSAPATMSSPTPGTVLAGSSVTFTWTTGTGVTEYELRLGTTGAGSSNLYNSGTVTATTEAVTGLPTTGATVTATLYSLIGSTWQSNVYTYTEATATPVPAVLTTPTPGTVLAGSSVTFTWTAGTGVTEYELRLGTTGAGSSNLYNSGTTTATTKAVTGLPTTGATVTATLYSLINGTWRSNDYTYTEASPTSYSVALSWDAPKGSAEPVAGYKVYRSPSGSSTYQLLNSSVDIQTTYVDRTVQSGQSYDYIVESVDDAGVESAPTSPIAVSIP